MDTCGFPLALSVTPADVQDRNGARILLAVPSGGLKSSGLTALTEALCRMRSGVFPATPKVKLEIVKRSDDVKGFKVLPKRWIACGCLRCAPAVERTFGWLSWTSAGGDWRIFYRALKSPKFMGNQKSFKAGAAWPARRTAGFALAA